jgi:hypothetical protein
MFCTTTSVVGQYNTLVEGDGNIITQKKQPLDLFTSLVVEFPATVQVKCKSSPFLEITTDKNILDHIAIDFTGNELRISQAAWIEPSKGVKISIGTAFINQLETGGYGTFTITNIDGPSFSVINPVGDVSLSGKTDKLKVQTNTGNVNASQLQAKDAFVQVESWGTVKVAVSDLLEGNVYGNGNILYKQKPNKVKLGPESEGKVKSQANQMADNKKKEEVQYYTFNVFNNKLRGIDVIFEGPANRRFSYGTHFKPLQKKKESFPAGTKIYEVNEKTHERNLLVTLEAKDADQTTELYED